MGKVSVIGVGAAETEKRRVKQMGVWRDKELVLSLGRETGTHRGGGGGDS